MMKRRTFFLGAGAVAAAGIGGALVEHRRMGTLEEYGAAQAKLREALAEQPKIPDLIRHATLAPSGHNTQPWTFGVDKASISLLPDWSRRTPVVDPDNHHLCAAHAGGRS